MSRRVEKVALSMAVFLVAGVVATAAKADGLPVLGVDVGSVGLIAPGGDVRYVTLPAGEGTVVAKVQRRDGRVLTSRFLQGKLTIPAVAYDGSASGLSADGRTLVLIEPRVGFPREQTTLAVLGAPRLRPGGTIRLRGDFSFDAVSPNGAWLYLIEYVSPHDPTRYLVRAYDLQTKRLLAEPITDPVEPGEKMGGSPITRATSADGRWAYTLYDGAGKTPFLHALDTQARTARCIDLDGLGRTYLNQLRLRLSSDGASLTVLHGQEAEAVIDTRTFHASGAAQPRANRPGGAGRHDGSVTWLLVAMGVAAVAATGGLSLALRHRRRVAVAR